ncbi:GNAT family N-acetyltransferase [Paenibacillus silvisoli]|uniref:GNAT family N-acetyltransferase n=1 Tax=Paenibacillus silvisoli TaxID=3110539 RepID=UPI00280454A9|nr:GNAT family N-acetyltransferase [Paenibacillus silvisoli]
MIIENITPDDVEAYWRLRLEALRCSPEAFGSTYESAVTTPLEAVKERIQVKPDQFILGAYSDGGELVGMVGFRREESPKMLHKGFVWGMYVSAAARQQGVGRKLMLELLNRASKAEGLEQINLMVVASNENARGLYLSLGFEVYGLERRALKYDGNYYDEELMVYWI